MGSDYHLVNGLAVAVVLSFTISLFPLLHRSRYLSIVSLVAAGIYFHQAFIGFIVVITGAYLIVRSVNQETDKSRRWRLAWMALVFIIIFFTLGRWLHWERGIARGGSPAIMFYTVDMWLALRLVTLFWEVGTGLVSAPSPSAYITWVCLPFTLGGPLLRLSQMPSAVVVDRSIWKNANWWMHVLLSGAKLSAGIALGVAQRIMSVHLPNAYFLNRAAATFLTGPIGFYLATAGYFQLMEVLGQPAGFKLGPSFNCPMGRENISAFWMNWNMTATYVFRDYIFFNRWGRPTHNIYFNTMVLFTLVGLWHAANAYWILWGFLHGLLFCSFLTWQKYKKQFSHIPLSGTRTSRTAARVVTYLSVCMAWYLPSKILQIGEHFFIKYST